MVLACPQGSERQFLNNIKNTSFSYSLKFQLLENSISHLISRKTVSLTPLKPTSYYRVSSRDGHYQISCYYGGHPNINSYYGRITIFYTFCRNCSDSVAKKHTKFSANSKCLHQLKSPISFIQCWFVSMKDI